MSPPSWRQALSRRGIFSDSSTAVKDTWLDSGMIARHIQYLAIKHGLCTLVKASLSARQEGSGSAGAGLNAGGSGRPLPHHQPPNGVARGAGQAGVEHDMVGLPHTPQHSFTPENRIESAWLQKVGGSMTTVAHEQHADPTPLPPLPSEHHMHLKVKSCMHAGLRQREGGGGIYPRSCLVGCMMCAMSLTSHDPYFLGKSVPSPSYSSKNPVI